MKIVEIAINKNYKIICDIIQDIKQRFNGKFFIEKIYYYKGKKYDGYMLYRTVDEKDYKYMKNIKINKNDWTIWDSEKILNLQEIE